MIFIKIGNLLIYQTFIEFHIIFDQNSLACQMMDITFTIDFQTF